MAVPQPRNDRHTDTDTQTHKTPNVNASTVEPSVMNLWFNDADAGGVWLLQRSTLTSLSSHSHPLWTEKAAA